MKGSRARRSYPSLKAAGPGHSAAQANPDTRADLIWKRFADPAPKYSLCPIWWWSGDRLDAARLTWQLERFADGGVYNVVILNLAPNGPLYGSAADDPPYQSVRWWELFRHVCGEANRRGIAVWFYDQLGFSGSNFQAEVVREDPAFAGQALGRVSVDVSGYGEVVCPSGGSPIAAFAIPLDHDGRASGQPNRLVLDGRSARSSGRTPQRLLLAYAIGRGFDYFGGAACRRLISRVHGEFEAHVGDLLGTSIVGSFQDELPDMPTWSTSFAAEFCHRYGYDLVGHLASLWEDVDARSPTVRRDYHALRAELAEEAFFKPIFEWHEEHGLVAGFDQQEPARTGSPIDAVRAYADYPRTHRWYGAPGSDHHGDAKVHSSIAHLYDRPRTWLEAFHSTGWGGTLEETFDWLLPWIRAGANLINPHAFYYSTRGSWWEWAPPATDWRQPFWRHHSHFAKAIARLCSTLTTGRHVCDVAVLSPMTSVQAGLTLDGPTEEARSAQDAYVDLVGRMRWYDPEPGVLDRLSRDYDVVDDESVTRARITDATLDLGVERYLALILPACTTLLASTLDRVVEFAERGGLVVCYGSSPSRVASGDVPERLQRLQRLVRDGVIRLVSRADDLEAALEPVRPRIEAPVPTLHRSSGGTEILFVPATAHRATIVHPSPTNRPYLDVSYDFDPRRYARSIPVRIDTGGGSPRFQAWEPFSGRRTELPFVLDGEWATVEVPMSDGPAALLVWGDELEPASAPADLPVTRIDPMPTEWESDLVPSLDNRWGDFAIPSAPGTVPVETWRFRHSTESWAERAECRSPEFDDSGWEEAHATFGIHGERAGPIASSDLPLPVGPDASSCDWAPVRYSETRGVLKDPLHRETHGPKGYVPEEFLVFGSVRSGEAVQFRASLSFRAPFAGSLLIGAAAAKRVWLDGEELPPRAHGYSAAWPVRLEGEVSFAFRLDPGADGELRSFYAFVADEAFSQRPEWLTVDGVRGADSVISFTRSLTVDARVDRAVVNVGSTTQCRTLINGRELGRQGDFDPYFETAFFTRVLTFDATDWLEPGTNEIRLDALARGANPAVFLDALVEGPDGVQYLWSDDRWEASDRGQALPVRLGSVSLHDPAWPLVRPRPHPLPLATWLRPQPNVPRAVRVVARPRDERPASVWLRLRTPPGTTAVQIPLHAEPLEVYVDGVRVRVSQQVLADDICDLRFTARAHRPALCAIRVRTRIGFAGGAMLAGPARFIVGEGRIQLGDWADQGLRDYSGAIRYRQRFDWSAIDGSTALDLGRVRGTAEVWLNGNQCGVRVLSPYVFDLTPSLREGSNSLDIIVTNTLAPHFDAVSPTHMILPGQEVSGLFGPVRLVTHGG